MRRYFWTAREISLVREHYPVGGVDACLRHVQRGRQSIYQRAASMGLRAPGQTGVREHWPNDPEIDARIKRLHETPLHKGAIAEFAKRISRPRWYVSKRARELGLKTPRFKEAAWSAAEIQILHDTAHVGTKNARRAFARHGYSRSETAIHVKRKRERISVVQAAQDAGHYTANQVADLFGIDGKTVGRWISMKEMPAKHRGTDRTQAQGGDMWSIAECDLREFIITHPLRVELRKIPDSNRAWFIELIAGRAGVGVGEAARAAA
jgi:hypothetical protein